MMNDKDILLRLLQQAYTDDTISQAAKREYEKLVTGFDKNGADLEISVNDLDEAQEMALRNLREEDYTTQSLRYHGPGVGHILHVNLRGKKFLEMANDKRSVVVGMTDSGERQSFETGAVRDTADGKPRPDLISPFALERLGEWLRLGSLKYSERNWEKGIPVSRSLASLYRHLLKFQQGATDEDHLAAIMCNAMFVIHTEEMIRRNRLPKTLDDMPDYSGIDSSKKSMRRSWRNGNGETGRTTTERTTMIFKIDEITIAAERRRIDEAKVRELAASIQKVGLLNPITIVPVSRGNNREHWEHSGSVSAFLPRFCPSRGRFSANCSRMFRVKREHSVYTWQ